MGPGMQLDRACEEAREQGLRSIWIYGVREREKIRVTPIFCPRSLIEWQCHLPKQETRLLGQDDVLGFGFFCFVLFFVFFFCFFLFLNAQSLACLGDLQAETSRKWQNV